MEVKGLENYLICIFVIGISLLVPILYLNSATTEPINNSEITEKFCNNEQYMQIDSNFRRTVCTKN